MSVDAADAVPEVLPCPRFRTVLRVRGLPRLLVGHTAGTLAQQLVTLAVGLHVLARTSSGVWVSVTVALGFAPYALLSGAAGALVDRRSRSAVLAASTAVRAVGALTLVAALVGHWPLPALVAVTALTAAAATPAYPALAAAASQCVPDHDLPAANALVSGVENVAWIAGPGLFGLVLLTGHGPLVAVCLAAALFTVGALATAGVGLPRPARPDGDDSWHGDLPAIARLVWVDPTVRAPMAVAVLDNLVYGYLVVALVLLASGPGLGWLNAALTVGALLGMTVVNRMAVRSRPLRLLGAALAVFACCVMAVGLVGVSVVAAVLVLVAGATTVSVEVVAVTLMQRATAGHTHGRVLGIYDQLAVGSIALGSLVAGPLARRAGPGGAMVAVGLAALVVVAVVPRWHRG